VNTKKYVCDTCGAQKDVPASASAPECCGAPMRRTTLEPCERPSSAETARLQNKDEACNDGVL
jgi:hypothetical protein